MNKKDIKDFLVRYGRGQMMNQRLGQAFINFFGVECGCHKISEKTGKIINIKYCIFNDTDEDRVMKEIRRRIR